MNTGNQPETTSPKVVPFATLESDNEDEEVEQIQLPPASAAVTAEQAQSENFPGLLRVESDERPDSDEDRAETESLVEQDPSGTAATSDGTTHESVKLAEPHATSLTAIEKKKLDKLISPASQKGSLMHGSIGMGSITATLRGLLWEQDRLAKTDTMHFFETMTDQNDLLSENNAIPEDGALVESTVTPDGAVVPLVTVDEMLNYLRTFCDGSLVKFSEERSTVEFLSGVVEQFLVALKMPEVSTHLASAEEDDGDNEATQLVGANSSAEVTKLNIQTNTTVKFYLSANMHFFIDSLKLIDDFFVRQPRAEEKDLNQHFPYAFSTLISKVFPFVFLWIFTGNGTLRSEIKRPVVSANGLQPKGFWTIFGDVSNSLAGYIQTWIGGWAIFRTYLDSDYKWEQMNFSRLYQALLIWGCGVLQSVNGTATLVRLFYSWLPGNNDKAMLQADKTAQQSGMWYSLIMVLTTDLAAFLNFRRNLEIIDSTKQYEKMIQEPDFEEVKCLLSQHFQLEMISEENKRLADGFWAYIVLELYYEVIDVAVHQRRGSLDLNDEATAAALDAIVARRNSQDGMDAARGASADDITVKDQELAAVSAKQSSSSRLPHSQSISRRGRMERTGSTIEIVTTESLRREAAYADGGRAQVDQLFDEIAQESAMKSKQKLLDSEEILTNTMTEESSSTSELRTDDEFDGGGSLHQSNEDWLTTPKKKPSKKHKSGSPMSDDDDYFDEDESELMIDIFPGIRDTLLDVLKYKRQVNDTFLIISCINGFSFMDISVIFILEWVLNGKTNFQLLIALFWMYYIPKIAANLLGMGYVWLVNNRKDNPPKSEDTAWQKKVVLLLNAIVSWYINKQQNRVADHQRSLKTPSATPNRNKEKNPRNRKLRKSLEAMIDLLCVATATNRQEFLQDYKSHIVNLVIP